MVSKAFIFLLALSTPLVSVLCREEEQTYSDLVKRYQKVLVLLDQANVVGKKLEEEAWKASDERSLKTSKLALFRHKEMMAKVQKERDYLSLQLRGVSMKPASEDNAEKSESEKEDVAKKVTKEPKEAFLKQYHKGVWALHEAKVMGKKLEEAMWNATMRLESLQGEAHQHKDDKEFSKKLHNAERLAQISKSALSRHREAKAKVQKEMDYLGLKLRGMLMKAPDSTEDSTVAPQTPEGINDPASDHEHQVEEQSGREELNAEALQMKTDATLHMMQLRHEQAEKEEADGRLREVRWTNIFERQKLALTQQYQRGQWVLNQSVVLGKKLEEEMWNAQAKLESLQKEVPQHENDEEFAKKLQNAKRLVEISKTVVMRNKEKKARAQKEVDYLGLQLKGVLAKATAKELSPPESSTLSGLIELHKKTLKLLEQVDEDAAFLKKLDDKTYLSKLRHHMLSKQQSVKAKLQKEAELLTSQLKEAKDAGVMSEEVELAVKAEQKKFEATLQMVELRHQQEDKQDARKELREQRWKRILERQALAKRYQKVVKAQELLQFSILKAEQDAAAARQDVEKLQKDGDSSPTLLQKAVKMDELAKKSVSRQKDMQKKMQEQVKSLAKQLLPMAQGQEKEALQKTLADMNEQEAQALAGIADRDLPPSEVLQEDPEQEFVLHPQVRKEVITAPATHDLASEPREEKPEPMRMIVV